MQSQKSQKLNKYFHSRIFTLSITIISLLVFMSVVKTDTFFTKSNLNSSLITLAFDMLLACGMTIVLMLGCVDLSVGSTIAFVSVVIAKFLQQGMPALPAVIIGLLIGISVGVINGLLVGYGGLAPFVATLGTQSVLRGFSYVITSGYSVTGIPKTFSSLGQGSFLGISNLIWISFTSVAVLAYLIPNLAIFKKVYLVGTSKDVAYMSGINSNLVIILGFAISGLFAGLCGVLMTSRYAMGSASFAAGYETRAIAAAVIGGAVMAGGEGSIVGTTLGVLLVGLVNNSFIQFGGDAEWQTAISGVMLVVTLFIDVMKSKRSIKKGMI